MATEPKTDAKTEAKQEAKAEAKEVAVEGNTEPSLKYKTWVLKVSVHCEGCKRKVKKILDSIDGVCKADVDLRLQKATVVGDVDADTLIKKLIKKTGKHAELWPEKADNNQKAAMKKGKAKNKDKEKEKEKEKERDQESSNEEGGDGDNKKEVKVKAEGVKIQDPSPKNSENGPSKNSEGGSHVVIGKASEGGAAQVKEVKVNEVNAKQPVTSPSGVQSPVADKKVGESEVVAEKIGGGGSLDGSSGAKKKKKKGHKENSSNNNNGDEGEHSGHAPAGTGSPGQGHVQVQIPAPANHIPPRHDYVYDYPATYNAPPVYAVSSNVAYPSTSYGASYYAPQYSYAYMHPGTHPGTISEPPPPDFHPYYSSQTSDSFQFLSDENPNACSIM
ncbi:PREDICTED: uncharacterized protein LOC105125077 [Populus euphratica]|uniref:Uncharacterized protein LOC105125077 n=1 Tax=Populus euphratica TaxID=75702 RepID=A0AAJ6U5G3_POPEU|nr:PREDICTED: uncharacterized protein LOC105125077 [Populus euphratica]